jgi:class 3 adenylate cyclase
MFADLADSTAMSQDLDPEDLRDINIAYQDAAKAAIERYGGFVARYMGDGVLAYFGFPAAHEDDANRAVRAGLALIDAVANTTAPSRLSVRVGIATGFVVVGDVIGEGASQESAVVDETPNLAAQLQAISQSDAVTVCSITRALVGGHFAFEQLLPVDAKGIRRPIVAFRPVAPRSASRFDALVGDRLSPLVGRSEEVQMLANRWALAQSGEGQVVVLSGEAGIGKSRLTHELTNSRTHDASKSLIDDCASSAVFRTVSRLTTSPLRRGIEVAGRVRTRRFERNTTSKTDTHVARTPLRRRR